MSEKQILRYAQDDNVWVDDNAWVDDNVWVDDNAWVDKDNVWVDDSSQVGGLRREGSPPRIVAASKNDLCRRKNARAS